MQPVRKIAAAILMMAVLSTSFAFGNSSPAFAADGVSLNKAAHIINSNGDNVRIREGAGVNYDAKATMTEGQEVWVLEGPVTDADGREWYRVSFSNRVGWIAGHYLQGGAGSSSAPAKPITDIVVGGYAKVANTNGDSLRVRSTAGGKVVATFAPAAIVSVTKGPITDDNGKLWFQVKGSSVTGWVMADFLVKSAAPVAKATTSSTKKTTTSSTAKTTTAKTTTSSTARTGTSRGTTAAPQQPPAANGSGSSIVAMAMKYVGSPYRYAGTTPAGFDCSGFVYYIYNKVGIGLSRSMSVQIASGTKISSSQLQPGDLVYFSNTYKKGISHIAIYAGNGKIVHAADYGVGVTISDLWSPYWVAHYTGAVRIRG